MAQLLRLPFLFLLQLLSAATATSRTSRTATSPPPTCSMAWELWSSSPATPATLWNKAPLSSSALVRGIRTGTTRSLFAKVSLRIERFNVPSAAAYAAANLTARLPLNQKTGQTLVSLDLCSHSPVFLAFAPPVGAARSWKLARHVFNSLNFSPSIFVTTALDCPVCQDEFVWLCAVFCPLK